MDENVCGLLSPLCHGCIYRHPRADIVWHALPAMSGWFVGVTTDTLGYVEECRKVAWYAWKEVLR